MNNYIAFILLAICSPLFCYNAFICAPVTDYIGSARSNKPIDFFNSLSFSASGHRPFELCPRIGQGLFQEQVTIVEKAPGQVRVEIPQQFFITKTNRAKQFSYWMLEQDIIPLDNLRPEDRKKIPAPLDFNRPTKEQPQIVTLQHPWYCKEIDMNLSSGTRFVVCSILNRGCHVRAYAYHPTQKKCIEISIPKELCIFSNKKISHDQKVKHMIELIRDWCLWDSNNIPYVLGGSSYVQRVGEQDIIAKQIVNKNGAKSTLYQPRINHSPLTGIDCAALICRTAQIAQLPFYYKNSITMALLLKPLTQQDSLHEGDVIWVPGHVMMIADIANNTIFEARSYEHGYGKVQEIPISTVFQGIATLHDLVKAFHDKKALYRKDKTGAVRDTYQEWKILKLSSAWDSSLVAK